MASRSGADKVWYLNFYCPAMKRYGQYLSREPHRVKDIRCPACAGYHEWFSKSHYALVGSMQASGARLHVK